jgi:chromosome segregation ATPase
MKRLSSFLAFTFVFAFLWALPSNAQQTEARKKTPRLTTDDVITTRTSTTTETPVTTTEEPAKKAGEAVKSGSAKSDEVKPDTRAKASTDKTSTDESVWREQVAKARERAESLDRTAEEAELRTTQLRNELGNSGQDTRQRNATAAELDNAGKQLTELKTQARAANAELKKLLEEGSSKGFTESQGPKATAADGKPNVAYYKTRYEKLMQTMRDAERHIQLYENRVRSLNESLVNTNRDRFTSSQLEQDRNEAQDKANEARAALSKAQTDLESLINEGRAAGIPPGLFR